jgi:hypothetical protein
MQEKTIHQRLCEIQKELKVGKEHNNSFGKYKYRKAEDILKAVKELLEGNEYITTSADIQVIQDRFYVVVKACFHKKAEEIIALGFARESQEKKGMDDAQLTGATTSYAKKYALCNLFAIDDEIDADDDSYGKVENKPQQPKQVQVKVENKPQQPKQTDDDIITKEQKEELEALIEKAGGDKINICNHFKVEALTQLKLSQYQAVKVKCEKTILNTNAN